MASPINDLAEIYSSILYHISDYEARLTDAANLLTSTLSDIDQRFFMSLDFLDYYKEYPRYPLDYKVINNLGKYNLVSIYSVVQNDVKYLLDAIDMPEVLGLKNKMDKLPDKDILQDYNLQTTYFTSIYNELLERNVYGGFLTDKTKRSYLFKTFGHYVPMANKESSLIYEYVLYAIVTRNMRTCLRIYEKVFNRSGISIPKNTEYINYFAKYIDENKASLAESFVRYILEYTYRISDPSAKFTSGIVEKVSEKIGELADIFGNSLKIQDNVFVNMVLRATEYLHSYIGAMFANSAADSSTFTEDNQILSQHTIDSLKKFEMGIIDEFEPMNYKYITDKYSVQTFRQYLYLVYYYKAFPRKFLNVLQMTLINFVIQTMVDRELVIFNPNTLISYFHKILGTKSGGDKGEINMDAICGMLEETLTPQMLLDIIQQQGISEYTTRIEMVGKIEEIFSFDNPEFEEFIDELYNTVFDYLKKSVQIEPYYEYHFNKKMIYWYLIGCIKRDILNKKVFYYHEELLDEVLQDTLESDAYNPESEKYAIKFDPERMRARTVQHIDGNISNIGTLFDNIVETAAEKKLHSENISYFFN